MASQSLEHGKEVWSPSLVDRITTQNWYKELFTIENTEQDMAEESRFRFRSFAERYLIERAKHFAVGKETEEGWACIEDAKKLYGMVEKSSEIMFPDAATKAIMGTAPQASVPFSHKPGSWKQAAIGKKSP